MSAWEWLLLSFVVLIWLYFASQLITLGVLKSIKCFFVNEAKRIQDQDKEKNYGKNEEKKKHEKQGSS